MQILSQHILGVAIGWVGRVSSTAVVRSDDSVAGFGERDRDMAELVGCLWEAVDEEYGALRLAGGWETFNAVNADLRVGLLEPNLTVVGDWDGLGCHC